MSTDRAVVEQLRTVPLFAGLGDRALAKLAAAVTPVDHAQGKEVAREGADGVGFHLVVDGAFEVEVRGEVVRSLGPGDHFGEISLLDGKPRSATVRATQDARTLSLTAWSFGPLLDREPELARGLLLALCARLREAEARPAG